jgi:hypothetical protein
MTTTTTLRQMLDAYDQGDGTEDMREFVSTWAALLAPPPVASEAMEVLVTGDPFGNGLAVEGPYRAGTLENCDLYASPAWIVALAQPTITEED